MANGASVTVSVGGADSNREADVPACAEPLRPLSAEDLSILALENEIVAGHTCKVIMLGDPVDASRLRESIAGRVQRAPAMRMRLRDADGEPYWMLDDDVDLDRHVVVADAPEPVDMGGRRCA